MQRFINDDADDTDSSSTRVDPFEGLQGGKSTSMSSGAASARNGGTARFTGLDSMSNIIGGVGGDPGELSLYPDDIYSRQKMDMSYSRSHGGRVVMSGADPVASYTHLDRESRIKGTIINNNTNRNSNSSSSSSDILSPSSSSSLRYSLHPDRLWPSARGNEPLTDSSGAPVSQRTKPLFPGHLETQGKIRNNSISGGVNATEKNPHRTHPMSKSTPCPVHTRAPWANYQK